MRYSILRTDKADVQIRELIYYIADDSGDIEIALSCLDKLEKAVSLLEEQPYYGTAARHPSLRRQGLRVLIVEKYLVFYKVRERGTTVIVYAVVDSRRNYTDLVL